MKVSPRSIPDATDNTMHLWFNARLATLRSSLGGLGEIDHAALVCHMGRIVYAGPQSALPNEYKTIQATDCEGRWITPGLVDCHTHIVHAGNRAKEFELRLAGATYEEIARAGGGIVSSVNALRAVREEELVKQALPRLDALISEGVTTIEIKSGYGLTVVDELKMLRAARALATLRPVHVTTTYLGAHAVPQEYKDRKSAFISEVVIPGFVAATEQGLADAVDGFCEGIAFSPEDMKRVFETAARLGLPIKLHADQLSNLHGAELAASFGALSADHLEYTDEEGCIAMAKSGTVAVLLPGAYYFLRETRKPPIAHLRKHGVPMAIATDCNPGSSPLTSLLLTMNMAATLFGMSVHECLAGVTREAAKALGRGHNIGTLDRGKQADFVLWNIEHPAELVYRMGFNPLHHRVIAGKVSP